MKVLFVAENFRQGWGGGPESVRLMARRLARFGVTSDVVDSSRVHRAVENLSVLPMDISGSSAFSLDTVEGYDALLQVGPWQNPLRTGEIIRRRSKSKPYYYLPRGGLSRIEFEGLRNLKKFPYFAAIEAHFLRAADAVIYSSEAERGTMTRMNLGGAAGIIVPDYFEAPAVQGAERSWSDGFRLGFLAEIAPRKGLLPFMRAFARWAPRQPNRGSIQLSIGGGVRGGAERYFERVREVSAGIESTQVGYLGPVGHADRAAFYANTDLFVVPSLFESFGLTVLEAASAGCVLLCSPKVGALEYFPPSSQVIISDDAEPTGLEEALDRAAYLLARLADRQRSIDDAHGAVAAINDLADRRWAELLHFEIDLATDSAGAEALSRPAQGEA
ncbi:MAG: glycosyltransferase family 4 protein [Sphingomonas sp.]|jgi:glycosyltransferase involved in cell wall biosynthesis|uniref:glycosyltransferase family 4 protein n=1 Tax=Sphingomonas sp. TaxID=28214 RepID=UPI0035692A1A